jgi:hypothetical protein
MQIPQYSSRAWCSKLSSDLQTTTLIKLAAKTSKVRTDSMLTNTKWNPNQWQHRRDEKPHCMDNIHPCTIKVNIDLSYSRIEPSVSQSRQVYIWLPLPAYTTMPFADLLRLWLVNWIHVTHLIGSCCYWQQ